MLVLVSALLFFLLITGLILIHEFGHFLAARKAGVEVEEFGFGLPPRVKTLFHWKGTNFSLNWIPFGGFVRLKGESAVDDAERTEKGSFASVSLWKRGIILVAGVAMNFLLALLIFLFGFSYGKWIPTYLTLEDMEKAATRGDIHLSLGVVVEEVLAQSPAAKAGLPTGSMIVAVDGEQVTHPSDIVRLQEGKSHVRYRILTGTERKEEQEIVVALEEGKAGLSLRAIPRELSAPRRSLLSAFRLSLREARVVMEQTVIGIVKLVSSLAQTGTVPEGITGIVGIAQLTYTSVQAGLMVYLRLVALLSLSLAVLNILPFPALDGGRLLFVLAEGAFRHRSRKLELVTNTVGFAVLLLIILLVTFYDVLRLFI